MEVEVDGVPFDTGLRKFGALLGDGALRQLPGGGCAPDADAALRDILRR